MSAADQATRARRTVPQGARSTGRTAPDHGALAAGLLIAAIVLWIASLRQIDPSGLDDLGIVSILPWTSWAALALLVAGFWLSLAPDLVKSWLPPAFLLGLVLVLHGTPAIAYETLRYSWAWKHVGIVDYIQRHGTIDPNAPYLAANHNWPGFFFVAAWVADFFGLKPLQLASLARFTPVVLNGLYLLVIVEIFRRFTKDWRAVWTACLIFLLGNWVGQDYFSPQGTAYLLYLACIALCVGLLRVVQPGAAEGLIWTLRGFVSRGQPDPPASSAGARALAAIAVLLIAAAIAATHQLTPLVLVAALTGLAVIGWANFGYAVFAVGTMVAWALYFATPFVAAELPGEVAGFGQSIAHVSDSLVDVSGVASELQTWVVFASRLLSGTVALAAVLGGIRRLVAGYRDGAAVVLTLAPVPLLAGTSYGGEIIFRVYLFALPFLAFFAAALFFRRESTPHSWLRGLIGAAFSLALAVGFFLANNGKDRQYFFSQDEVAAAAWLYSTAPSGSLLVEGSRNYPSQFENYEYFTYVPLSVEDPDSRTELLADPVSVLGRWFADPRWSAGYVVVTRSQKAYAEALGIIPMGAYDRLEAELLASPRFVLVFANQDARIFMANASLREAGPWADLN